MANLGREPGGRRLYSAHAVPLVSNQCQRAPTCDRCSSIFLRFAGTIGVRLEGFEPPTRGLGNRCSIP
jgi:hypothetical protein